MIGDWLDIGPVDQLPALGARTLPVQGGAEIAIFRTANGGVYALVNSCPHKQGPLSQGIILGYIWMLLLNGILAHWGRALTYSATYGFWGLVILVCWQQIGYMMIIYIAGMQSLPTDVLEAASVAARRRVCV